MKVIIAGGRDFSDYPLLIESCDQILSDLDNIEIVSGRARGADSLGEDYALERGYDCKIFPADWEKYGKAAGYKRNSEMAEYSDLLIAFWDGTSKGTEHMINIARKKGLKIKIINYEKNKSGKA
jgi:predicted Rossmann fold nucleotide-binding protein DprA/Smf involved in DNA uptake